MRAVRQVLGSYSSGRFSEGQMQGPRHGVSHLGAKRTGFEAMGDGRDRRRHSFASVWCREREGSRFRHIPKTARPCQTSSWRDLFA